MINIDWGTVINDALLIIGFIVGHVGINKLSVAKKAVINGVEHIAADIAKTPVNGPIASISQSESSQAALASIQAFEQSIITEAKQIADAISQSQVFQLANKSDVSKPQ